MKGVILFLALTSITNGLFAQESKKESRTFFPWDSLYFKNEISLDVSPVIAVFLSSQIGVTESFGMTYKRFFSKKNAFRIGYRLTSRINSYEKVKYLGYQAIAPGRSDSIILITTESRVSEFNRWQTLRTGYEHRFGKRRVKFILGVDIILGIEEWERTERLSTHHTVQFFDTSGSQQNFPPVYYLYSETEYSSSALSFLVGITPVVGLNIDLTKRWSLNTSMVLDQLGYFSFKHSDEFAKREHQKGYYFVSGAFIPDFSVSFHF